MTRYLTFLAVLLSVTFTIAAQPPRSSNPKQKKNGSLPSITRMTLDKNQLIEPCPYIKIAKGECSDDPLNFSVSADVETAAALPKSVTIEYKITGGTISSDGQKAKWNLAGVPPGTFN
jgi:hypothetical protein